MFIAFRERKVLYCDDTANEMYMWPRPVWQDGSEQAMLITAKVYVPAGKHDPSKLPLNIFTDSFN